MQRAYRTSSMYIHCQHLNEVATRIISNTSKQIYYFIKIVFNNLFQL